MARSKTGIIYASNRADFADVARRRRKRCATKSTPFVTLSELDDAIQISAGVVSAKKEVSPLDKLRI